MKKNRKPAFIHRPCGDLSLNFYFFLFLFIFIIEGVSALWEFLVAPCGNGVSNSQPPDASRDPIPTNSNP